MRTLALTTSALCGAALLLLVLLISLVNRPTPLVASVRERAERFIASQTLRAAQAQQNTIVATLTVGTNPNECATGDQITVPAEAPIYFCMRVTNLTTATLTRHQLASNQMKDGGLPLNQTIERYYLEPGATMVITNGFLSQIAVDPLMTQRPSLTSPQMSLVVTSSDLTGTLSFNATDSANVSIGRTGSELKEYINLLPSTCLQQDTVTLSEGQLIFYCLQLKNTGDVTLTHHILTFTEGLNTNVGEFDYPLSPGNTLTLTANTLNNPNLTFQRGFSLGPFSVESSKTLTLTTLSTNTEGYIAKATTSASIKVPQSPISLNLILWNELNTAGCAVSQGGGTLNYGDRILYCIRLRNDSSVPLTEHSFVEYLTPSTRNGLTYAYSATFSFNYTISAGKTLVITSGSSVLPEAVRALNVFGPFVVSKPITPSDQYINTILYEARNPTFSLQLKRSVSRVMPASAPATETPTITTSPTIAPTQTPPPGATATLALTTATPTATWTPVSVSVVIPPTETPQPHVLGVTTPFPGQFNSPLITPTPLPVAQSFLATPSFTPDFAVLAAAQTADFIATATMLALQSTPAPTFTPVGTDTPTATSTETPTPTSTPTATPTPTITQRPVEQATPVTTSNRSVPVGQMVNSAIIAAGWVWFFLGSLVFFVVAGVVAGLSFRQSERRRYRLDDHLTVRPPEAQPPDPPAAPPRPKEGDDNWPASLP